MFSQRRSEHSRSTSNRPPLHRGKWEELLSIHYQRSHRVNPAAHVMFGAPLHASESEQALRMVMNHNKWEHLWCKATLDLCCFQAGEEQRRHACSRFPETQRSRVDQSTWKLILCPDDLFFFSFFQWRFLITWNTARSLNKMDEGEGVRGSGQRRCQGATDRGGRRLER